MNENPKVKFPASAALAVAKELCSALKPVTNRLNVAGSLRRRKTAVGDVEILYVPQFENRPVNLFDRQDFDLAGELLQRMVADGTLKMRPNVNGSFTWGNLNKLAIHTASGIPVDFFRASDENWFNYLVCRTGSMESNMRIANAAIARGMKWKPYGCGFEKDGQILRVEKEEDAFELVGLDYRQPWER